MNIHNWHLLDYYRKVEDPPARTAHCAIIHILYQNNQKSRPKRVLGETTDA